jgi:hypothetical protein
MDPARHFIRRTDAGSIAASQKLTLLYRLPEHQSRPHSHAYPNTSMRS